MAFRYSKEALSIFLLLCFVFFYFAPNPKWNGYSRLDLILAVVHESRLTIDSYHLNEWTDTGDKAFYNGHYYSDKAIGTALLGTAVYYPVQRAARLLHFEIRPRLVMILVTFFVVGIPSALAGSLMYILCEGFSGDKVRSLVVTLAYALGTMCLPFSVLFFGHQLAAALLFIAFFLIFRLKQQDADVRRWHLLLIGFVLGFATITEFPAALPAGALGVYYLHVMSRRKLLGAASIYVFPVMAGLAPIAMQMAYNALCFGSPFTTAYQHLVNPEFQQGMSQGLMGIHLPSLKVLYYLTAHPARGILWHSPVIAAGLTGLFFMLRNRAWRAEAMLIAFVALSFLLINSGYFLWWGGYSFGPRHLVPMLPFLCLGAIFFPKRWFSVLVVLALVSVTVMIVVTAQGPLAPEKPNFFPAQAEFLDYWPIRDYILPEFFSGNVSLNLGKLCKIPGPWSVLPAVFVILGFVAFFCMRRRHAGQLQQP